MDTNIKGNAGEVFAAFLKLGLTSFGGPIAHLGYFRREFVERRGWVDESGFARLLALCQFLPGPASSQLGFALGLLRAGWPGAFAAFVAFTFPSAMALFVFATLLPQISSGPVGVAAIHGLKLVAIAVVAQGVLGMSRSLCPDRARASIAAFSVAILLAFPHAWMQLLVVALGAAAGLIACRDVKPPASGERLSLPYGARLGVVLLATYALLLIGLPLVAAGTSGLLPVIEAFYRAGALVFGGGHVVLPLLRDALVVPGWISPGDFLAGYGAAQAVPGPMFTLSAYLGARILDGGALGATAALLAIFLPGFLLLSGALPLWRLIGHTPTAARAVAGVNAAVVGLLAAALYDPVWTTGVQGPLDVAVAVIAFTLLVAWRASALVVVLWCVAASVAIALHVA